MNSIDFNLENQWNQGFKGSISITNNSQESLNGWVLEFEAPFKITQIWNAEILSQEGNRYTIRYADWNQDIASGETLSFGFLGKSNTGSVGQPSDFNLNGQDIEPPGTPTEPTPPTPTPSEPPQISINNINVIEGTDDQAVFRVELSEASSQQVSVQYATSDETAIAGSDYINTSGTLTFDPGETSKLIRVNLVDNDIAEVRETFLLNLSRPQNSQISDPSGVASIEDTDTPIAPPAPTPPQPGPSPTPQPGTFNYGEALQKSFLFYEANRSGPLAADNRIAWRGDSNLNDGSDVGRDLSGGYFDAGDHVKFGLPLAASMTMLGWGVEEYRGAYQQSGQLDEALAAVKQGTDYILKAHVIGSDGKTQAFYGQVGNGGTDHAYWGPPETLPTPRPSYKVDRQNPGSEVTGESAAALAAASMIFRPTNQAYANELVTNAEQLFEFADTYRGNYANSIPDAANFYNSFSGFNDELVWAATWLYKATGKQTYLDKAESLYQGVNRTGSHDWDNKSAGAAVLLAQETGKDQYKNDVEALLDYWSDDSGSGINYTDGGLAWHQQWGSNRHSANMSFLASVYGDTVDDKGGRYSDFARGQIDYLLGDNPNNFSYQIGFGENFARNPHHRGASGTTDVNDPAPNQHTLYGALVGGPTAPSDDAYADVRSDFIANEVALDYNAGFTGALASLYDDFGGNPLSDAQLNTLAGIDV